MVALDVVLDQTLGGVVEFVGVTPDGVALLHIGGAAEALEQRVVGQEAVVVAVGDQVAGVLDGAAVPIRGVEAEKLRLTDLLGVAEELITALQGLQPGPPEFAARGLAFDDQ
jgi:hypothetical protein